MTFAVGSLVRARGREWVVLPESAGDLLVLRPLGGADDEVTGIYRPLEAVEPAQFSLPDPDAPGDYRSSRLLRDAVRLGFRSSAGPFRCAAAIAVEPRPYQLVPLLLALRLDPVRLLIADDVGVGKTIEAALIARELLDRGEVTRLTVLCPPHLTEQWQTELRDKFRIEAEQVLPGTVTRLERDCGPGQSLFALYPHVVVSTDFIKSDRRRDDFLRHCSALVIVDEAHTCVAAGEGRGSRHQRHHLVQRLAADPARHLILVTATPHSGKEEAFRALLTLLDPAFADLPDDLAGERNRPARLRLAAHLVQRRRANIEHYMSAETPFPQRQEVEATYKLSPEYRALFEEALDYARQRIREGSDGAYRQRLRWWSVLALLRALASSPAAAAETLRNRIENAGTAEEEALDREAAELLPALMLDPVDDGSTEGLDVAPSVDLPDETNADTAHRRRLAAMARQAAALQGAPDAKLQEAIALLLRLLKEGCQPIVFCRFIPTAEYVAAALRERVPKDVAVEAVTSTLPAAEREERVLELAQHRRRVLVCTDCLSEGLNLQEHFDAVMHYDLSWNPTRHEQREGRVDRYGQPRKQVRVITYYGADNQIDGIVLDVLVRKSKTIRSSLGISVPLPADAGQVVQAIFEGLQLRERPSGGPRQLELFPELRTEQRIKELHAQWDAAADREKRSRALFAQEAIRPEEVARELDEVRAAIGAGVDVASFTVEALQAHGAAVNSNGHIRVDLSETPRGLRDLLGAPATFEAAFELPVADGVLYLQRTHPLVENLAAYVIDSALDPLVRAVARRAGVIVTRAVERRTTLLLVRFRYHIIVRRDGVERPLLAEDARLLGFAGAPHSAEWLSAEQAEALLSARPDADLHEEQKRGYLRRVVEGFEYLRPRLDDAARERGAALLAAHRRVREATRSRGGPALEYRIEPQLPPDVLGLYVYLPA